MTNEDEVQLKPFLKWPGGKTKELKVIIPAMPKKIRYYYEPFIGGGAVYFATPNAKKYFINDKSKDLVDLYRNIKCDKNEKFLKALKAINSYWKLIDTIYLNNHNIFFDIYIGYRESDKTDLKSIVDVLIESIKDQFTIPIAKSFNYDIKFYVKEIKLNILRKMTRMKQIELQKGKLSDADVDLNILTALKSSFYMYFRQLLNKQEKYGIDTMIFSSIYYFIRNYTYSGMFRYNANGDFNVPYGGIGYNNNNLDKKISYISGDLINARLHKTEIEHNDFYDFMKNKKFDADDFIFLDPPYDTEFSTYDQNEFTSNDQVRLANFLIYQVKCKWMLVIKNTSFIYDLYKKPKINVGFFDKTYQVSFMNRNDKNVEHLIITNY